MLIALALFLFLLLVVIHEYGHFLSAKRNGVEVEEFGIGFPPKVVGKTMGRGIFRSYYTINLLPLGGFVRLKGETDSDKRKGSFGAATFWVKTKIIMAGVLMNFIAAIVIFTILAATGMPQLVENQFSVDSAQVTQRDDVIAATVVEDSPAEVAGVRPGDILVSIGDDQIDSSLQLFDLTEANASQTTPVTLERDGQLTTVDVTFNDPEDEQGFCGVGPTDLTLNTYGWSAPIVGVGTTIQFAGLTYQGLANTVLDLFQADFAGASEQVSGPVGLVVIISNISIFGISYILYFVAIISLTLAIINALPIPALDGGRLFVSGLFKVLKKPLTEELEQKIHGTGFAVLMGLIVLITVVDIRRFF